MPLTIGTSYFVSESSALRYYLPYGYDKAAVFQKLAEGDIHIGKPPLKEGQRLITLDNGQRYGIVETEVK